MWFFLCTFVIMDIKIIEVENGFDAIFNGKDLEVIKGIDNMPLLSIAGGNIEESTKIYLEGEERFDWWGNSLLFGANRSQMFNSDFERLLNNITLSSSTRIDIEEAIKKDLSAMAEFSEITVAVSFITVDVIKIDITIDEPKKELSQEFSYIWNETKKELLNNG